MKRPLWSLFSGRRSPPSAQTPELMFSELSADDVARLDQQRAIVANSVRQCYGNDALTRSASDLPVLQRLLDDRVFEKSQTYELQCLGVVFGDILASQFPLHWVIITDEFGSDPTLRFGKTSININTLTMISKRVERGEPVNVLHLLEETGRALSRLDGSGK